jgi:nucleotide-binding universal stress UspA family protein
VATLMVHLELGHANPKLLQAAADLAGRLNADVMGIAACQPLQIIYGDGYVSGDLIEQDREELEKEINDAETEFRAALQKHSGSLEWRSTVTFRSLADYLADQARCADLVITGVDRSGSIFDSSRHVDIGDLIMQLGRPALIVPAAAGKVSLQRVLIGWKDTRESRRAALDALPLLKKADHVAVCEIASEEGMAAAHARLEDVVSWLKRDGIAAEPVAALSTADDATRLNAVASDQAADVIVAGAYGHSRLREWALGGVTKDLLLRADRCSFVSH